MKIWIDILTPKQANFLGVLATRLERKGHAILITTRRYREVNQLLDFRKIKAVIVGRYGGDSLVDKLLFSAWRVEKLSRLIAKNEPDIAISFSSPEAARVSYGLGIPHYCVSDSPHAEAVCRLTIPLSKKLFTPRIIPKKAWMPFGISSNNIVQYDALDPIVWIREFKPVDTAVQELGLETEKPIITIRLEEAFASYLLGKTSDTKPLALQIVGELLRKKLNLQIIALARYGRQSSVLKQKFGKKIIVPREVVDGLSLLSQTSVFIGGGGTMTAEAALMGIPSISYFPSDSTYVEKYLIEQSLLERLRNPREIADRVSAILKDTEYMERKNEKAQILVSKMEDPLNVMMRELQEIQ